MVKGLWSIGSQGRKPALPAIARFTLCTCAERQGKNRQVGRQAGSTGGAPCWPGVPQFGKSPDPFRMTPGLAVRGVILAPRPTRSTSLILLYQSEFDPPPASRGVKSADKGLNCGWGFWRKVKPGEECQPTAAAASRRRSERPVVEH